MIKLSRKDEIILANIEFDTRITAKKLAKLCHLSKDGIKYRLKRLESLGIIDKYTNWIDYKKLGHQSYKLYLKLNCDINQLESIKEFLRKQKFVFAIFEGFGNWKLAVAIFAKTQKQFHELDNDLLDKFGSIITKRTFCSMIDAELYEKNFFEKDYSKNLKIHKLWGDIENNSLDEKNKKIIKILHENSRIHLITISQKLKLSIDAIKNRIKKLESTKIITTSQTNINYELLGYDKYKLFIYPKEYSEKTENKIIEFLKYNSPSINIIRTIGPWKLEVEFLAKNQKEIELIIYELNKKFTNHIADLELSLFRNEELFACKELLLD